QSAAMLVVAEHPTGQPWRDKLVDIRVDDAPEPLKELKRLLNITRAYDQMNAGDEYLAEGKMDEAAAAYAAANDLAPGNVEILYWHAVTLASIGEVERSLPIFREVFEKDAKWRTLTPRLVTADLLPDDADLIGLITSQ
ncbi:MAG: Zn-dependent protease, partial [bacterium]|nr:Zn-dependent protease [bacterium]